MGIDTRCCIEDYEYASGNGTLEGKRYIEVEIDSSSSFSQALPDGTEGKQVTIEAVGNDGAGDMTITGKFYIRTGTGITSVTLTGRGQKFEAKWNPTEDAYGIRGVTANETGYPTINA